MITQLRGIQTPYEDSCTEVALVKLKAMRAMNPSVLPLHSDLCTSYTIMNHNEISFNISVLSLQMSDQNFYKCQT